VCLYHVTNIHVTWLTRQNHKSIDGVHSFGLVNSKELSIGTKPWKCKRCTCSFGLVNYMEMSISSLELVAVNLWKT
jgi:hypothetical protein